MKVFNGFCQKKLACQKLGHFSVMKYFGYIILTTIDDFKRSQEFEIDDIFLQKQRFHHFQRLSVPRIIDQFGCKRCQKKRKDVNYQLI